MAAPRPPAAEGPGLSRPAMLPRLPSRATGNLSTGRSNSDCRVRERRASSLTFHPHLSRMRVTETSTVAGADPPPPRALPLTILAYLWALPTTFIGLLFVPAALVGGGWQVVDGVLE